MKIKATRKEIRECVENAVLRVVSEGKSSRTFDDNNFEKKAPKHGKLDKKGTFKKQKGNKGNRNWAEDYDE